MRQARRGKAKARLLFVPVATVMVFSQVNAPALPVALCPSSVTTLLALTVPAKRTVCVVIVAVS